jgi:outer membrane protein TolC
MKQWITSTLALLPFWAWSQQAIDLHRVIEMAIDHSPDAAAAHTQFENSRLGYKLYRAQLLPSATLAATLPNFNSSITAYDLDDGSQQFISRSLATSLANVNLSQNIGLTGGTINLSSGLQRIDVFGTAANTSFLTTPLSLGYSQRVFNFNTYRWMAKTEPMKLEEARRKLTEDLEGVAIKAINLFFNYYDALVRLDLAKTNLSNSDTLYKISKGRYQLGRIAEHELLQMELNVLHAQKSLRQARIDLMDTRAQLENYTGLLIDKNARVTVPLMTDTFTVDADQAVRMAMAQGSAALGLERQTIEADREYVRARTETMPNFSINASYGISGSDKTLADAYGNTLPQRQFRTGVSIPLSNGGAGRHALAIAENNRVLNRLQTTNRTASLEQEVRNQANQFNFRNREYAIAATSDAIGQKQYDLAYQRYLIGKIGITDLNIALQGKDQARRAHIQAMRNYWADYYRLRQLTLFDFKGNFSLLDK